MVRTGIVGLGYWGPNLLRNFGAQPSCQMIWGCDMKEENIDKTKRHYPALRCTTDYDDLLNDPELDLILIATPTSSHFTLAKRALEAGKHVFVEKPMTATTAEAEELVRIAKNAGKHLFIDHTFVFAPAVRRMAQMANDGSMGDLLYFDSVRINLGLIQKDVNALWDLAIHDLSILGTFTDLNDVRTVCAHGSSHFGTQEENVHMHLTYKNGFTAHIHVSWLSPVKIRRSMLGGTKAMLVYDDTEPSEKLRVYDSGIDRDETKADPFFPKYRSGDVLIPALPPIETLGLEAKNVIACIEGKEKATVAGEDGLKVVRILECAHESLRNNSMLITVS